MKRYICTLLLVAAGAAAFGLDFSLSAGAGGLLGGLFTRYTLSAHGSKDKVDAIQEADQFNYGFFAFFDATYGIFSVSFQNGSNNYREEAAGVSMSGKGWESMLGLSLLGKYPFSLNDRFTVFPLLGIEYQISLVQLRTSPLDDKVYRRNDDVAFSLYDWNSFFINLGGGLDFKLPSNFYLRGEMLYGIRLMTPYEQKNLDNMKSLTGDSNPKLGGLCSGPALRISAGWRFFSRAFGVK